MNNKLTNWAFWLAIFAIVVSATLVLVWILSVRGVCVVSGETFITALIAILGLLFTLLMGWNIYTVIDIRQVRDEMRNSIAESQEKFAIHTNLSDAYAYYNLAELYFEQKKYVYSYIKFITAILYFEKAKEHNLALHLCGRIYHLIRIVRHNIVQGQNSYVLDYDLFNDYEYGKNIAELSLLELGQYEVPQMADTFLQNLKIYTKHSKIEGSLFTLYTRDANIKRRSIAIYLLMKDDEYICKTMKYDAYKGLIQYDLNLDYNIVAIAEFPNLQECKLVYDKIAAKEIITNAGKEK